MSFLMKLTAAGAAKIASANAGDPVELIEMAAGDGSGAAVPTPTGAETELVNEVWRGDLSSLSVSVADPSIMVAEAVIPTAAGPFTVREIGIFDAEGDLFAYGNFPETYKPTAAEGSAREMLIRASLRVAATDNVTILIDESAVFATQAWSNGRFLQIAANLADVDDPEAALENLGAAPIDSPLFINNPRAPTPPPEDDDTTIPNTAWTRAHVAAAIDAQDWTQIGSTINVNSGSSFTIANIPQTYEQLLLEIVGLDISVDSEIRLELSANGSSWPILLSMNANAKGDQTYVGGAFFPAYRRSAGVLMAGLRPTAPLGGAIGSGVFPWNLSGPLTHLRVSLQAGIFSAGTAKLLGM